MAFPDRRTLTLLMTTLLGLTGHNDLSPIDHDGRLSARLS
jgi:hypothetical protein